MKLTEVQKNEMNLLRSHLPFRVVYCAIKEGMEHICSAVTNMRIPNKLTREGWTVFIIKPEKSISNWVAKTKKE